MNSKQKGNLGVGQAINHFLSIGYIVSLPINDSQPYDLIVDFPDIGLKKIEIKTTLEVTKRRIPRVDLRSTGGNQSRNYCMSFNPKHCDFVFVHAPNHGCWLIPSDDCKNSMNLGEKYIQFKIR